MLRSEPRLKSIVCVLALAAAAFAGEKSARAGDGGADGSAGPSGDAGSGSTCDHSCLDGTCVNGTCSFAGLGNTTWTAPTPPVTPAAGATKVAVIGAQMVYSDKLPRKLQFPAMLQVQVGTGYDVENFGDCCSSVTFGYPKQPETHPYLSGQTGITPLTDAGAPLTPGYQLGNAPSYLQSIQFAPDVVVIGAWGKHDTELADSLWGGNLDPAQFKSDYERMVTTYLNLPNKPRVIVSTPIPLPKGAPTGLTTTVMLPATKDIAAKYSLETVDLYDKFLNHPELFKDDTHVTNMGGLETISEAVYEVLKGASPPPPPEDGGAEFDAGSGGSSGGPSNPGSPSDSGVALPHDGSAPGNEPGGAPGGTSNTGGCVIAKANSSSEGPFAGLLACGVTLLLAIRRPRAARRS